MDLLLHLKQRHMDVDLHYFWKDDLENTVIFPLWNLTGQMVGYQNYRPLQNKEKKNDPKEGRYFTYRNKETIGVWGLESWNLSNVLFVTEGIFDACRLTYFNYSAIALLSNNPNASTKRWLWTVRKQRPVVTICDSGPSGIKLAVLGHDTYIMQEGDLGDATHDKVLDIIHQKTKNLPK